MSKELLDHVNKMNAKARAWLDAAEPGWARSAAIFTEEDIQDRMEHNGVKTPADWDALLAWEEYYDLYKDYNGISPRWTKWSERTAEKWEKEIELLGL